MNENYNQLDKELNHLVQIIARLRAEDGCPWDREQTHASLKAACVEEAAEVVGMTREFDSSFFGVLMQILYLSHLRLIFLSNFVIFIVLLCTLCGIIKKTDFIIGEKRYVYIYHWK